MDQEFWVPAVFLKDCFGPGRELCPFSRRTDWAWDPNISTGLPSEGSKGKRFATTKFAPAEVTHASRRTGRPDARPKLPCRAWARCFHMAREYSSSRMRLCFAAQRF
jgi:hypothetical protein